MKKPSKSIILRILKITGITFGSIILLMFLMPILFPGKIAQEVKAFANKKLNGELNFKEAKLSFFNHFPSLTLTLTDFSLKGSAPYQKETLIAANEVSFGIDIGSLIFDKSVTIDKIYVSNALINVKVNTKGEANYNVYIAEPETKPKDTTSNTSLRLDKIAIEDSHLVYDDQSTKILIDANGFNYIGNGDLDKAIFTFIPKPKLKILTLLTTGNSILKTKRSKPI